MKTNVMLLVLSVALLSLVSCGGDDPTIPTNDNAPVTDSDTVKPDTTLPDNQLPDSDTTVTDNVGSDSDTPIADNEIPDTDTNTGDCATSNLGKNCKIDGDCGACLICVNAKCAEGCQGDGDCSSYTGTTCNKKLARCVNTVGSSGACNETNCPAGCCYADKGFKTLKCLASAALQTCGICPQGQVYMDGKQCIPSACKVEDGKCKTYNSTEVRADCYECKTGDLVCYDNPSCNTGSALLLLNAKECIPAGDVCSENDTCCSGQPCIQGYCY